MKKILLFFTLILLFGCDTISEKSKDTTQIDCPSIYFSKENRAYSQGDLDDLNLDKINYKATVNNYAFTKPCFADSFNNNYFLNLLILVEPIKPQQKNISMPIFAILYDEQENIIDKYYFKVNDNLNYNEQNLNYELTEVISYLDILTPIESRVDSITIGFVKIKK